MSILALTVRYSFVVAMSCVCRSWTSFCMAGFRLEYGNEVLVLLGDGFSSDGLAVDRFLALINLCCFCNWALSGSMDRPCLIVDRAASY